MAQTKLDSDLLGITKSLGTSLGSGGIALSGDSTPDTGYLGYNYTNVSGVESAPTVARSSYRIGFSNGTTDAITFGRRAASAAAGAWTELGRFDASGNLLVGVASGSAHVLAKPVAEGGIICGIVGTGYGTYFRASSGVGINANVATMDVYKNVSTGRSINAAGTVNAGGADYAEYMTKAEACGVLAKGQVVGIDVDGHLTDQWAAAVSFLIKSTDPSYVGGDVWGTAEALGMARPIEPVLELPAYTGAPAPGERPDLPDPADLVDVADKALEQVDPATVDAGLLAYDQALAAYQVDQLAHADAIAAALKEFNEVTYPAYQVELAKFEALLEAARQRVDRMAYCGQVPVNVTGATPGQYVVPIADGDGIGAKLVNKSAMTLAQYMAAVGIVQNILPDGRANVRVKPV